MSFEAGLPGDKRSPEEWQMICCRYYTAGTLVSGKKVLEIGCGSGRGLGYLSARAKEVIGGDYSTENLDYAHRHYGNRIELLALDALSLPFRDGIFDVIVAMEVLQYISGIGDLLAECRRVLKSSGILCLCLPNIDAPGFIPSPLGRRYYSAKELHEALENNYFDARIFGAFPIKREVSLERTRAKTIMAGSKILDIIPGSGRLREFLNKRVLGQTITTKLEIEDTDMKPEYYTLDDVTGQTPDRTHKILYAIANTVPASER